APLSRSLSTALVKGRFRRFVMPIDYVNHTRESILWTTGKPSRGYPATTRCHGWLARTCVYLPRLHAVRHRVALRALEGADHECHGSRSGRRHVRDWRRPYGIPRLPHQEE